MNDTNSIPRADGAMPTVLPSQVDLSNCDREAIHLCGAIQPHAALLVVREPDLTILQASENTGSFLGVPFDALLGRPVNEVLGDDNTLALQDQLQRDDLSDALPHLLTLPGLPHRNAAFHVFGHRGEGGLLLEFESGPVAPHTGRSDVYARVRATLHRLQRVASVQSFFELAVEQIREFTGFDRVMAYRFAPDGSGEVIAEARDPELEPYLGLHYPAVDIPEPARRLFRLSWLRHLPDVDYVPVPIVPELSPATGEPLDLSYAFSRSVSVMYTGYLRNMGARATLVMTLLKEGRLWGLISCIHHRAPRHVPFETRMAAEFLAHMVSLLMSEKETVEQYEYRVRLNRVVDTLLAAMSRTGTLHEALADGETTLLTDIDAAGAALVTDGRLSLIGGTPSEAELLGLAEWLAARDSTVFVSESLAREYPPASAFAHRCAGLLAIRLSRAGSEFLMWFRPEMVQEVHWAGDPNKPVEVDPLDGESRLMPRSSFALWKETVTGGARPWLDCEIEHAEQLRRAVVEVIVERAKALTRINEELQQSNLELDSFAYAASHDLKEPLRGIANFARFLQTEEEPRLSDEGKQRIETILRLSRRMHDLLESLLQYSRVGRIDLELREAPIEEVVAQALHTLKASGHAQDVDIRILGALPVVRCDRVRVGEVFHNLLTNAIKYNSGAVKRIEIGCDHGAEPPVFFVRDNGIGIAEKHHQRIFDLFRRLHGRDEYGGGTGAGLTIAKKSIERHGGRIWVDSAPDKGTTFYFTLSSPKAETDDDS